jgi:predicted RNase H-like HicB family nuclease
MSHKPPTIVLKLEDDGRYSGSVPEWPGCFGEGDSAELAIAHMMRVAESWVEACQQQGQDISTVPAPCSGCTDKDETIKEQREYIHGADLLIADLNDGGIGLEARIENLRAWVSALMEERDTLQDRVEALERELLRQQGETTSETCRHTGVQSCHVCEDLDCGDNTNTSLKEHS